MSTVVPAIIVGGSAYGITYLVTGGELPIARTVGALTAGAVLVLGKYSVNLLPTLTHRIRLPKYTQLKKNHKAVVDQAWEEFGMPPMGPVAVVLVDWKLNAGFWCALREIVLAEGVLSRTVREAILQGVSESNECSFCAKSHKSLRRSGLMLNTDPATKLEAEAAYQWGKALRDPKALAALPELYEDPRKKREAIAVGLLFHFTNKIVDVFVTEMPHNKLPRSLSATVDVIMEATMLKGLMKRKPVKPGLSFPLLPVPEARPTAADTRLNPRECSMMVTSDDEDEYDPEDPRANPDQLPQILVDLLGLTAGQVPFSGEGPLDTSAFGRYTAPYEALFSCVFNEAQTLFSAKAWRRMRREYDAWNGESRGLKSWVKKAEEGLSEDDRAILRLGLLGGMAATQVTDAEVAAVTKTRGDRAAVFAVATGALLSVLRVADIIKRNAK